MAIAATLTLNLQQCIVRHLIYQVIMKKIMVRSNLNRDKTLYLCWLMNLIMAVADLG